MPGQPAQLGCEKLLEKSILGDTNLRPSHTKHLVPSSNTQKLMVFLGTFVLGRAMIARPPHIPQMSAAETTQMSALATEDMSAVETGPMSAAQTGQMSAVETRQMSAAETGQTDVCC